MDGPSFLRAAKKLRGCVSLTTGHNAFFRVSLDTYDAVRTTINPETGSPYGEDDPPVVFGAPVYADADIGDGAIGFEFDAETLR